MCSVGVGGLEPPTSRLSGERSNQLSYTPMDPMFNIDGYQSPDAAYAAGSVPENRSAGVTIRAGLTWSIGGLEGPQKAPRKEVIHPHLPVGIPCYDFTLVTDHSLVSALLERLGYPLLEQSTPRV